MGLCLLGGMVADIIKASNTLCAWLSGISQILITSNTLQHFDVLGVCISISVHAVNGCVRDCTYRRGLRCCLFGCKGNTRASLSGTATVQSRFFCYYKLLHKYIDIFTEMPIADIKWRQNKLMYYVN